MWAICGCIETFQHSLRVDQEPLPTFSGVRIFIWAIRGKQAYWEMLPFGARNQLPSLFLVEGTYGTQPLEYDIGSLSHINMSIRVKKNKVTLSKSPVKVISSKLLHQSHLVTKTTNTTHKNTKPPLSTEQ